VRIIMDAAGRQHRRHRRHGQDPIWNLTKLNVNGNEVSGDETRSGGTVLPPVRAERAGQGGTGEPRCRWRFPFAVWDAPQHPAPAQPGPAGRLERWQRPHDRRDGGADRA
jgi:hypothetical protein